MAQLIVAGNATSAQVLTGTTFSAGAITGASGAMPNNGTVTITPSGSTQTIAAGYHNGSGTVPAVVVPAANVLTGTTIAGTPGTMPNRGTVNITPSASNQAIAAGYHNGSGIVAGDADLISSNIRNAINIFGITGNLIEKRTATGSPGTSSTFLTFTDVGGNQYNYKHTTVSGLSFTPSIIFTWVTSSVNGYNYFTTYYSGGMNQWTAVTNILITKTDQNSVNMNIRLDGTSAYVVYGGFRLPTYYEGSQSFLAIE